MIKRLTFNNYKPFRDHQELDLKPMTVLIGKNSSGKSAVTKLAILIENSLNGDSPVPLLLANDYVDLGAEFKDLVFGRARTGVVEFGMQAEHESLNVVIGSGTGTKDLPQIFEWKLSDSKGSFELDMSYKFKGFIPQLKNAEIVINEINLNVDYFGPFRVLPQRDIRLKMFSKIEKVGFPEDNAYQLLIQDSQTTEKKLIEKVSNWYKQNFEGWGIRVNEDMAPIYHIELTRLLGPTNINIVDAGQGMSQALPLVVRALMPIDKDMLFVMEQPELHLHPAAHGDLAELFVNSLAEGSKRYLIETHSQNFVLRLRRLVAQGTLKSTDIALYFVDFEEETGISKLKPINVDELGEVEFWPENIFNESLDEVLAIRRAQKIRAL
jgi:predicted ATPase